MSTTPISVIICCYNAQDTLAAACASVAWADELVIVDSGSTDGTIEIARGYADRFEIEPWRGYTQQKEFAAQLAGHDWLFILDSDETCDAELANEMCGLTAAQLDARDVFIMRRRNYIYGRQVRAWWPDWQARLFHRGRATVVQDVLHDSLLPASADRLGRLPGALEHKRHSRRGFEDYFSGVRLDQRIMMVARDMHQRGRRCSGIDLLLRPWAAFIKQYLLKGGFFDGSFGLMLAQKTAMTTQLKYAALWAVQHDVADAIIPPPHRSADTQADPAEPTTINTNDGVAPIK